MLNNFEELEKEYKEEVNKLEETKKSFFQNHEERMKLLNEALDNLNKEDSSEVIEVDNSCNKEAYEKRDEKINAKFNEIDSMLDDLLS